MSSDRPSQPAARPSLSKQPVDRLLGRVIADKYKINALIARGGMGRVYKAEQAPLGRVCAVKVLTPPENGTTSEDEFRKRFFLEASIGAKLTHPNTVTIFDYGVTDDGVYFIAMEYLEGKTLARVLKEDGPFSEERAAHIARQICRSLREAHAHGVIHRDLKPANVYLVSHADEADVVKVLDFGLVKEVESDGEDLTQTGLFMGSPKYMAPEQIRGEHVDARTDIYALGVILYEMMTGKVPYDKAKQVETLLAHVNESLPEMRSKRPELVITELLETVILRCLAKNATERYNGMADVLECLKGTAGGGSALSRTSELESLRASGSFTPAPSTYRPHASGEIPAANPTSIAPVPATGAPSRKWVPMAIVAAGLVAIIAVLASRKTEQPIANASDAAKPTTTQTAVAPTPTPTPTPVAVKTVQAPVSVTLDTEPAGARVRDEAHSLLCDKTPCKLNVDVAGIVVVVEHDGYGDQKVKLAQNDPPRMIKLTKNAAVAAKPAAPAAAKPTTSVFKPDPYASGPY